LRTRAMPYCCRRLAPASTCSAITPIVRKYSSMPYVNWPCRVARSGY